MAPSDDLFRENTLEMTVGNTGFIVDRLGQDCAPLQYLRELTQNSIEAIQWTEASGEIIWDLDWIEFDLTGTKKLCIMDTGVGMTGEEMGKYINRLSSSVHLQTLDGNYGVGAKIAGATRNHAGMLYLSWKDGHGEMAHLWRDPGSNKYGLRQLEHGDEFTHWAAVEDSVKPDEIEEHGTKVVLLGMSENHDTMTAPEGAASPSRWVARYLNTRYFRFPENVTVKAREGWEHQRSDRDRNLLRTVTGQEDYLTKHAASRGVLELTGARAHWWILKDEKALTQQSGSYASAGHMAALHKNELYEMASGRGGVARLQQFGVLFGYGRVVIYVEPIGEVTTNTARTLLLIDNEPLPWADWAAEFRVALPAEIRQHMDDVITPSSDTDRKQAIRDRLKRIEDLLRLNRYRRAPQGDVNIGDETPSSGGQSTKGEHRSGGSSRSGGQGGRAGSVYALFIQDDGTPADRTRGSVYPQVDWVSLANGKREAGDLEDRAARYLHGQNRLLINEDFRVFGQMIDKWSERYGDAPATRQVVTDVVQEWFEQALVEAILSAQSLSGRFWTVEDVKDLLNEQALTAVVLPRYHIDNAVVRALGSKLGTLKAKEAS